uniref:Protein U54 n=1 Tax=Elephantid herpesvirus 1 (isolate Asian elephant/Berlin/Kiba/1998) TaxID=654902 RepID=U54_ELHVK|nr:RecName: Full=Protein U54 [Elephantid herpesvirus 1 (isolate Kiba)]ABG36577.1 ORF F [Elephantid betaherpesvirus 1]
MITPLWFHVTQQPDGTYFNFIEIAVRLNGTLVNGISQTLLVPAKLWEHTGLGKIYVVGSMENKLDVDFCAVRYSDILGGFCMEVSNPHDEPLTFNHEVQRFILFSPQIYPISYQFQVLRPPSVSFPKCKANVSSDIIVHSLSDTYVFIKIQFNGITWEDPKKFDLPTGPLSGPFWMSYPVAVLNLPRKLYALHHYLLSRHTDTCDSENCYYTNYIVSRSCFHKRTLYLILTGIGTSKNACYAKDLLFCGIFSTSHVPEGDDIPQLDPAYNVHGESLLRDTLPIINPSAHCNTFQTFTHDTVALFAPDEWHSSLLNVAVWRPGKILTLPGTFVQNLPTDHKPIIPVGDAVFLVTQQLYAGHPNHIPARKIRALVSKTYLILFPLNLTFRLDELNPICFSEKPQSKLTLPQIDKHPSFDQDFLKNFSIDEMQLISQFFDSLRKMYTSNYVRTLTKRFHGNWNRWPSCRNHQFNQLLCAFYSF